MAWEPFGFRPGLGRPGGRPASCPRATLGVVPWDAFLVTARDRAARWLSEAEGVYHEAVTTFAEARAAGAADLLEEAGRVLTLAREEMDSARRALGCFDAVTKGVQP